MTTFNTDILDNLIVGRIEPHIYAFTTNTVPNYLKVGDTYRPVNVRLDEWRDYFPNLEHDSDWEWLAKTENGKYFRDFAIHIIWKSSSVTTAYSPPILMVFRIIHVSSLKMPRQKTLMRQSRTLSNTPLKPMALGNINSILKNDCPKRPILPELIITILVPIRKTPSSVLSLLEKEGVRIF